MQPYVHSKYIVIICAACAVAGADVATSSSNIQGATTNPMESLPERTMMMSSQRGDAHRPGLMMSPTQLPSSSRMLTLAPLLVSSACRSLEVSMHSSSTSVTVTAAFQERMLSWKGLITAGKHLESHKMHKLVHFCKLA